MHEAHELRLAEAASALRSAERAPGVRGNSRDDRLRELATLFGLATWGTAALLRRRIAAHTVYLEADDRALLSHPSPPPGLADDEIMLAGSGAHLPLALQERVLASASANAHALAWGNLVPTTGTELARACRERGLRSIGVSDAQMRGQLADWLATSCTAPTLAQDGGSQLAALEHAWELSERAVALYTDKGLDMVRARVQSRSQLGFLQRMKDTLRHITAAAETLPSATTPSTRR